MSVTSRSRSRRGRRWSASAARSSAPEVTSLSAVSPCPGTSGSGSWAEATWARRSSGASRKTGLMPDGHLLMADVRSERLEELKRLYGVVATSDNVTLVRRADVVILAVKPQILGARAGRDRSRHARQAPDLRGGRSRPPSEIRRHLPPGTRLIRVMPNTPALVLEGATAIARADGLADGRSRHGAPDLRGGRARGRSSTRR